MDFVIFCGARVKPCHRITDHHDPRQGAATPVPRVGTPTFHLNAYALSAVAAHEVWLIDDVVERVRVDQTQQCPTIEAGHVHCMMLIQ